MKIKNCWISQWISSNNVTMQHQGLCLWRPLRLKINQKLTWACPWWNGLDCSEQSWFCFSSFIHVYKGLNYLALKSPCSPTWLCERVFLFWNPSFVKFRRCFDWAECSFFFTHGRSVTLHTLRGETFNFAKLFFCSIGQAKPHGWTWAFF